MTPLYDPRRRFSSTADNLPYSMTLYQGIHCIDDDTFFTGRKRLDAKNDRVNKNIYDLGES